MYFLLNLATPPALPGPRLLNHLAGRFTRKTREPLFEFFLINEDTSTETTVRNLPPSGQRPDSLAGQAENVGRLLRGENSTQGSPPPNPWGCIQSSNWFATASLTTGICSRCTHFLIVAGLTFRRSATSPVVSSLFMIYAGRYRSWRWRVTVTVVEFISSSPVRRRARSSTHGADCPSSSRSASRSRAARKAVAIVVMAPPGACAAGHQERSRPPILPEIRPGWRSPEEGASRTSCRAFCGTWRERFPVGLHAWYPVPRLAKVRAGTRTAGRHRRGSRPNPIPGRRHCTNGRSCGSRPWGRGRGASLDAYPEGRWCRGVHHAFPTVVITGIS